ncbi:MAG TPA: hypothetical protein VGB20_04500 [bacterium]
MGETGCRSDRPKRKGLLARWLEKLDRTMEKKSRQSCGCSDEGGKPEGKKSGGCC